LTKVGIIGNADEYREIGGLRRKGFRCANARTCKGRLVRHFGQSRCRHLLGAIVGPNVGRRRLRRNALICLTARFELARTFDESRRTGMLVD